MLFPTTFCGILAAPICLGEGREALCSSGWVLVQCWGGVSLSPICCHAAPPLPLYHPFQVLISAGLLLGVVAVVKYRVWDCSVLVL